jgi:hypothetical protein
MSGDETITFKVQPEPPKRTLQLLTIPASATIAALKQALRKQPNDPLILYLDSYFLEDHWLIGDLGITLDSVIYIRTIHPSLRDLFQPRFEPLKHSLPTGPVPESHPRGFQNCEHSEPNPQPAVPAPHDREVESNINNLMKLFPFVDEAEIRQIYAKQANYNFAVAQKLVAEHVEHGSP